MIQLQPKFKEPGLSPHHENGVIHEYSKNHILNFCMEQHNVQIWKQTPCGDLGPCSTSWVFNFWN